MKIANLGRRSALALPKAVWGAVLICMAIYGVPGTSAADDSRTWAIHLSAIDEKNLPVPDATVELRLSNKLAGTFKTDAAGKVTLQVNLPGTYSLNIQKKGYLPADTSIEVKDGNPVAQDIDIDIDVVLNTVTLSKQSVEVNGEASNPLTEPSTSSTTLAPENAKDTPLRPATLVDALPLIPGIVRGPDGSVRIAGFGEDHSALLVNSVDVTDPATGALDSVSRSTACERSKSRRCPTSQSMGASPPA